MDRAGELPPDVPRPGRMAGVADDAKFIVFRVIPTVFISLWLAMLINFRFRFVGRCGRST